MKRIWKFIHRLIIVNFLVEIVYSTYMVFFVIARSKWPLFRKAIETPLEVITKRRLYAIETWLAIGALCIYIAVTEVLPRQIQPLLEGLQIASPLQPESIPPVNKETEDD